MQHSVYPKVHIDVTRGFRVWGLKGGLGFKGFGMAELRESCPQGFERMSHRPTGEKDPPPIRGILRGRTLRPNPKP